MVIAMENNAIYEAIKSAGGSVLLGIDGLVDEVWELLEYRTGRSDYKKITRLCDFGSAITERGTGGLAKERLLKRRSSGGFVANTGRATAALGVPTAMLGMFGLNGIDSVFDEFKEPARLISIGEPLRNHILEFLDGKIMMPNLEELISLKWEDIVKRLGKERLLDICNVDIVGVGYWSNLYDFEGIMTALVLDYLKNGRTKRMFHDFANLSKRSDKALSEALRVLGSLNATLPQTLSLNEHEGGLLARHLGVAYPENVNAPESEGAVLAAAAGIREKTGLDEVVIHTMYCAAAATAQRGAAAVPQNRCQNAVKTTGAGDTFNGGYIVSCLPELPLEAQLKVANAATRFYVEHAAAPSMAELLQQLDESDIAQKSPRAK